LIREALARAAAAGELPWPETQAVGGWWNRQFDPEIDLVGADRAPVAERILFAGSIKWLSAPFDQANLEELRRAAARIPGFDPGASGLVAVSRSGCALGPDTLDLLWGPEQVVSAWSR
jgi:uncharacterized protein